MKEAAMPLAFALLFAASLVLWGAGAPTPLVFALALPTWAAFAVVLAPAIRRYRAAMGVAANLAALEASGWRALRLRLAGLKVVALGLLTSALPFVGALAQWLGGQDLALLVGPDAAGRAGFVLGATVFVLPFLTSWLHVGALRDAAEAEPAATPRVGEVR